MKFPPVISRFLSIEAVFCILALAFPALWLMVGGRIVRTTLILILTVLIVKRREIRRDNLLLFCIIFSVFLFSEYFWQSKTIPAELFDDHLPSNYIYFCTFFVVLAYGTILWKRISPFFLLLGAAIGFVGFLILHTPLQQWIISWHGERADFGFHNAEHAGIFFGSAMLCTLIFSVRIFRLFSSYVKILAIAAWGLFFFLVLWGIIATQVRAVWLALFVSLLFTLPIVSLMTGALKTLSLWFKEHKYTFFFMLLGVFVFLVMFIGIFKVHERISARLVQEDIKVETIRHAANFDEKLQLTSSGARIAMWRAAFDWIAERPMLGWGVFSAEKLIAADERFTPTFKEWFGHLHNSYVEVLVATGIVGLTCMLAIVAMIYRNVYITWRAGAMPLDVFLFSWAFLTFWGIVNFFESYINYKTGFYLNSVMFGFIYAFCLHYRTALSTLREKSGMTRPGAQ